VRTLCLGEALVDLVCEQPVGVLTEAPSFVPHPGGTVANVCVHAARNGARVALAGGAGGDPWGLWLRERLELEGVDLDWFELVESALTAIAFVAVGLDGEPAYETYGAGEHRAVAAISDRLPAAIRACDALLLASNTLVEEDEREVTLAAREQALEAGRPVVFDPSLRLGRWPHPGAAASVARECVRDAFLVKCNRAEAELLSGEADPERAAAGLLAGGARNVIVTLGPDGAILRGEVRADAPGVEAEVVDATGAGDAFLGVVLAWLSRTDYYPAALAAALPEAVREAAKVTERWGAL
jgi:sugar/nucleoside kinase (ribokinase family)